MEDHILISQMTDKQLSQIKESLEALSASENKELCKDYVVKNGQLYKKTSQRYFG